MWRARAPGKTPGSPPTRQPGATAPGAARSEFSFGLDSFIEWLLAPPANRPIPVTVSTWSGIRQGNHKLVVSPEQSRRELYDVAGDPRETRDVSAANRDIVERLQTRLAAQLVAARQTAQRFRQGHDATLTHEEKEHLRSLGYLQ
jgi:hypothetical protein